MLQGKCVCACALVCLLVFAFVTRNECVFLRACMRVCVCVCSSFCAWLSAGKMSGCILPGTAKHGFGKKGPQHLLMCPPLYSCAASPLACTGLSVCVMVSMARNMTDTKHNLPSSQKAQNTTPLACVYVCLCCIYMR